MGYLEKQFILHKRNNDGKLLPIDYPVPELDNQVIKVIPLTRGELQEYAEDRKSLLQKRVQENLDKLEGKEDKPKEIKPENKINAVKLRKEDRALTEELVLKHIIQPKFTRKDLEDARLIKVGEEYKDLLVILMDAVYAVSGLESTIDKEEEKIKKN